MLCNLWNFLIFQLLLIVEWLYYWTFLVALIFLISPWYLALFTALPLKTFLYCSSLRECQSSFLILNKEGDGWNSAVLQGRAKRFQGQAFRHSSQPYILFPIFLPVSGFKSPRYSMVRYERHLSELSLKGPSNAFVGQASRQRVHEPHWLRCGES